MSNLMSPDIHNTIAVQKERILALQYAIYSQADPNAAGDLNRQLAEALKRLDELEKPKVVTPPRADAPPPSRLLGPDTTKLKVETALTMNPVPTAIYNLLDPETEPLLRVTVHNVSLDAKPRRVQVRAWIEGLSAETVRTVE